MTRARAFNLLEVAVASAIAGIIALAALSAFAVLNRQLVRLQAETTASDDAKTLIDFLVSDVQAVGGGQVRPWMALNVENGDDATSAPRCTNFGQSPCGPSDRLTYALLVPTPASVCKIVDINDVTHILTGDLDGTCCLSEMLLHAGYDARIPPILAPPVLANLKAHTVAVSPNGLNRQLSLDSVNPVTCTARFAAGPMANIDNAPGLIGQFVGGSVSVVRIRTLYLNETTHELFSFEDKRDFNGADVDVAVDEVTRIASNIFDFQVQLGYDSDGVTPGIIIDQLSASDEWRFNAAGDGAFAGDGLRMMAMGLIVGVNVHDPGYSSSAQIIGGTMKTATGVHLRSAMGKAALRNIFVFF